MNAGGFQPSAAAQEHCSALVNIARRSLTRTCRNQIRITKSEIRDQIQMTWGEI
jgi:hypothetical protein